MSLQQRLDRIRSGFEKTASAETLAIMHRATEEIRGSGVLERALGEGSAAPEFSLEDSRSAPVALHALRKGGPVVLTFFRGDW
jgi:hypothetical protein